MDTKPTSEVIRTAANTFRDAARRLDQIATTMDTTGDLDQAAEAVNAITSVFPNLRMDLLVMRPIRALSK